MINCSFKKNLNFLTKHFHFFTASYALFVFIFSLTSCACFILNQFPPFHPNLRQIITIQGCPIGPDCIFPYSLSCPIWRDGSLFTWSGTISSFIPLWRKKITMSYPDGRVPVPPPDTSWRNRTGRTGVTQSPLEWTNKP